MQSSRLTLSWEDGYCIVSSYSVLLLVVAVCCYSVLLLLKYVDDLIIPALFSFIFDYFQIILE